MQNTLPKSPSTASLSASVKLEPLVGGTQPLQGSATVGSQETAAGAVATGPVGDGEASLQAGNKPEAMEADTAPRPETQVAEAQSQPSAAQQAEPVKAEEEAQTSDSDKQPVAQAPMTDIERSAGQHQ